jgi:hypothetical protein
MFGEDRLAALLAAQPTMSSPADLVEAVIDAVTTHSAGVFSDDIAVPAIGNPGAAIGDFGDHAQA